MRKLRALPIAALAFAALAACQPAADTAGDSATEMAPADTAGAPATAMAPAASQRPPAPAADELLAVDRRLWTAFGAHDAEPFRQNVTADYTQVVAGGEASAGRDAVIEGMTTSNCEVRTFDLKNPATRELAPGVVALTYTATQDVTCAGQKLPPQVYSTSIYVWRDGRWQATSYQETAVM